ncbi:hybrid sensor histidine kinase/response regulator, partial [Pseudomonas aeruginosa]
TRQLLAFSRRQVMQRQHVDLNLIVENLHSMLLRIVGEDVRLRVSLADKPLLTHADSSQIDQIILNLVVNSRDAMSGGGEISLETTERT